MSAPCSARGGLSKRSAITGNYDSLHLFARHLEGHHWRNPGAHQTSLMHRTKKPTMEWFHSAEQDKQERPQGSLASSQEIQAAFVEQRDHLHWIALIITGDHALADRAVISASGLSASYSSVFRDWLMGWTNTATVRAAVREVRDLISASASRYIDSSYEHSDNGVLSDNQIASLRQVDTRDIVAALDPLARSALVLRGIQHFSITDCALLLDMPRRIVAAAYCRAARWNDERAGVQGPSNEDGEVPRL